MKHHKLLKKLDIFLLIIFPLLSVFLSLIFKANFFFSILLFFGIPSIYFSFRSQDKIKKTLLFSFIFSIPIGAIVDYIGTINHAWFVPSTIFSFRLFNTVPVEDLIWAFFNTYLVVIFYEHFLDKGRQKLTETKFKYIIYLSIALVSIFLLILLRYSSILIIPYAYLLIGITILLLPVLSFLTFFPNLIVKFTKSASYFFFLSLLFELTGLQLNQWSFPSNNFIGWVNIIGYPFPFEELFFFMVVGTLGILTYYEFFDDDRQ